MYDDELEGCVDGGVGSGCAKSVQVYHFSLLRLANPLANLDAGHLARNKKMHSLHGNENTKCMVVNCTSPHHHWPALKQAHKLLVSVGASLHTGSSTIHGD